MVRFIKDKSFYYIAGTGHRPSKCGKSYEEYFNGELENQKNMCISYIAEKKMSNIKIISGMAQGWDTALALAAIELDLPLIAAIPCVNQSSRWTEKSKEIYDFIVNEADEKYVLADRYSVLCMMNRNAWMVDRCDEVLAYWDGKNKGGTYNCVTYAKKKKVTIVNLMT